MMECARETELLAALEAGVWPAGLRGHVTECAACAELAAVMALLPESAPAELPSAGFLWWKGQLQARRERSERAQRVMLAAEAAGLAGLSAALLLLMSGWLAVAAGASVVLAIVALPVAWCLQRGHHSE